MLRTVVLCAALALAPVAAQAEEHVGHDTGKPAKPPKEKKICRESTEDTGSRLGSGKICKTAAAWAAYDASQAASPVKTRSTHSFRPDSH